MRVIDLENINYAMRNETQFVLRCEEVFHDKISAAAAAILSNRQEKPVVALTGPSGSGKTTTAMRLQEYLQNLGVKVCLLSMDNFFLPLDKRPPGGHGLGVPLLRGRGHPADLHLPAAGRHGGRYPLVRLQKRRHRRL